MRLPNKDANRQTKSRGRRMKVTFRLPPAVCKIRGASPALHYKTLQELFSRIICANIFTHLFFSGLFVSMNLLLIKSLSSVALVLYKITVWCRPIVYPRLSGTALNLTLFLWFWPRCLMLTTWKSISHIRWIRWILYFSRLEKIWLWVFGFFNKSDDIWDPFSFLQNVKIITFQR